LIGAKARSLSDLEATAIFQEYSEPFCKLSRQGDVVGTSGRAMVEALIAGETDPAKLAALANSRIKAGRARLTMKSVLANQHRPRHAAVRLFWKVDRYNRPLEYGSPIKSMNPKLGIRAAGSADRFHP
jgi:hypothetical protein